MNMQQQIQQPETGYLPGDMALWYFLCAELGVFALLIAGSALVRISHPDLFQSGMAVLHPLAGVINTLALISGSYCVARAVICVRHQSPLAYRFFIATALTGMIYISVKLWEYQSLLSDGYSLHYDAFFTFYFLATFFHFMHVVAGVVIVVIYARALKKNGRNENSISHSESVAAYWHMVDLVWIVLFPALYFMRG